MKKFISLLILLGTISSYCFSEDESWDEHKQRGLAGSLVPGLIGCGQIILSSGVLMLFNSIAYGPSSYFPTKNSITNNLTKSWQWDTNGFLVNQIGHPYHGSYYFSAGRANGFGFYQSVFFNAFGSATWEVGGERARAALNDFYTTLFASMSFGEILYRLYYEALEAGVPAPLAFLINPTAGLKNLISKQPIPKPGRNLYQLQYHLGGGFSQTNYRLPQTAEEAFDHKGGYGELGLSLIYGNPFEQDTYVPFRHFEFDISFGADFINYIDVRLMSDGYLFSFSPVYTDKSTMSTGLSLHYNFLYHGKFDIFDSSVNFYNNALDWTIKYQYLITQDIALQIKPHAGFTFLGVSNFFDPDRNYEHANKFELKEPKVYGGGFNTLLSFSLEKTKTRKLEAEILYSMIWPYPSTGNVSSGNVLWLFANISYERFITNHFSLGIANAFSMERGTFKDYPDTRKWNNASKLFVAWNM